MEKAIREIFNIPDNSNVHLWSKSSTQTYEELPQKKTTTLQELSLMSSQTLVAEVQNSDGTWPRKTTSSYSKRYSIVRDCVFSIWCIIEVIAYGRVQVYVRGFFLRLYVS